jgi:hypothetical protein
VDPNLIHGPLDPSLVCLLALLRVVDRLDALEDDI